MSRIRIALSDYLRGTKTMVELPDDIPMNLLIPALVTRLELPTHPDGQPVTYRLDNRETGERIGDHQTLSEAGIQDQSVLSLLPEVNAGPSFSEIQQILIKEWFARTLDCHFGKFDNMYMAWIKRVKPPGEVFLTIKNPISGAREDIELSTNITPKRLLLYLVKGLQLPTVNYRNNPINYSLILETENDQIHLDENKTLGQSGVQRGDTLKIMPSIETKKRKVRQKRFKYLDFDLQITPIEKGYLVEVLNSPAGQASERIEIPDIPDIVEVENFILRITWKNRDTRRIHSPEWYLAQEFGKKLFQILFRGEVLGRLTASMHEAHRRKCGLRIKLRLEKSPKMMCLPWELLYDGHRQIFLATLEDISIVRFLSVPLPNEPMKVRLPLRILAMTSNPNDLPRLNVDEEHQKMSEALNPIIREGMLKIDWVDGGDLNSLHNHLRNNQSPYHIFHFIGHGGVDEKSGEGFLAMEGEGKRTVPISGNRLATVLSCGRQRIRLAILNACEGARTSITNPLSGMATSLMLAYNMPAVVGMQFEITDKAAIKFTSYFYSTLAAGQPIDAAVSASRLALFATNTNVEWAAPVLYMRSRDGRLFDIDKPGSKARD